MAGEALQLARKLVELWNRGDHDAIAELWDEYIVVRPDPDYPDGPMSGRDQARAFWDSQRETMGDRELSLLEEHDLGHQCLVRIHDPVNSRSGVKSEYEYSMILSVREGRVVLIEFFIDRDRGHRAIGLDPS